MTRRPNLFIIGAPKSGTTSLYEYLSGHPDVYMSPVKEPFYFAPDVVSGPRRRFVHGRDDAEYLALFDDARDQKRLGEASTTYLSSHVAPSLIHEFEPDARVVAMVRNPVDMVYALHNERVSHGVEPIDDVEAALAADDDRREGRRLPEGCTPLGAIYRDTGMYGEQLSRWLATFRPDRVHVIVFDDFVADTAASFRSLLGFLEIDPDYQPSSFAVHNPSHRLRGGLVRTLLESRAARLVVKRLMPRLIGQNATSRLSRRFRHSRLRRRPSARPPLSAALRDRLEQDFAADVALLGQLVGRDLRALWFEARPR